MLETLGVDPLDLIAHAPPNADDVAAYARARLRALGTVRAEAVAERVAGAAAGNFLYARYVLDELLADPVRLEDAAALELPDGLAGHYAEYLTRELVRRRERWQERYRPLLGLLAVARGHGLPRDVLVAASELEDDRVDDALAVLGQYLSGPAPDGPFRLYHQSFREYVLTSREHPVYPALAARRLAEVLLDEQVGRWSPADVSPAAGYALDHVVAHLSEAIAGATSRSTAHALRDRLVELLADFGFLDARIVGSGVYALLADHATALGAFPVADERRRLPALIAEVLRFDSQFLARHPTALLDRCWLRGWWFDSADAASFYGGWPAGRAPWEAPDGRLCELVERWRAEREARAPGARWLRALRPAPDRLGSAQLAVLSGHDDELNAVDVAPDGSAIVSCGSDGLRLWEAASGAPLAVRERSEDGWPTAAAFGPRGDLIVATFSDGTLRVLGARDLRELRRATYGEESAAAVACSPNGSAIAVGDEGGTVRLVEAASLQQIDARPGHKGGVRSLAFSPDGAMLASGDWSYGGSNSVCLWRLENGRLAEQAKYPSGAWVEDVAWSPDGEWLAWSDYRGTIELRGARTGAADAFTAVDGDSAGCLAFLPDGRRLAVGKGGAFGDAPIAIWDLETRTVVRTLHGHTFGVAAVRVFAAGTRLVSAGDGTVRIWSLEDTADADPTTLEPNVDKVRFSPDGAFVLTAAENSETAWARRIDSGEPAARLERHPGGVHSIAAAPDGRRVACGSASGLVRLWDIAAPGAAVDLYGHQDAVEDVAFSPDGHLLATASKDGTARVFAVADGTEVARFGGHGGWVHSVAFAPDGERVVSASYESVLVWSVHDGDGSITLAEPTPVIHSLCFTPDGREVVAETSEKVDAAWNAWTGRKVDVDPRHDEALALARGDRRERWRWRAAERGADTTEEAQLELVLTSVADQEAVAWLPIPYAAIHDHPSGHIWAIHRGTWLFVFALEPPDA